jgi:hypothetical protein
MSHLAEETYANKLSRKRKQMNNQLAEDEPIAANKLSIEDGSGERNLVANKAQDHEKRNLGKKKKEE